MKRIVPLFILFIVLCLEIVPFGCTLKFIEPDGELLISKFSYFSLVPYGYGNFTPLITAILTVILFLLVIILTIRPSRRLLSAIQIVQGIVLVISIIPLMTENRTWISLIITLLFAGEYWIIHKKNFFE